MGTTRNARQALTPAQVAHFHDCAKPVNNTRKDLLEQVAEGLYTRFAQDIRKLWHSATGQSWAIACWRAGRADRDRGIHTAPKRFKKGLCTPGGFLSNFAWRIGNAGGTLDDIRGYIEQAL